MRQFIVCSLVASLSTMAFAATQNPFFDDTRVHEIRVTFDSSAWYDQLYNGHVADAQDPYFRASMKFDDLVLSPVGVRFKGDASFYIPSDKKAFKIDLNVFDEDLDFYGLKKLNLENLYNDPSMLRQKLFLDFAAQYVPATRAVHSRLYINDVYWGLYLVVEQIDKDFAQSRFGGDEDGNLYEALGPADKGEQGSDLTWLGPDTAAYTPFYSLVTNETANDYSGLIGMIDVLNNTAITDLPAAIEPLLDVQNALYGVALNALFVNMDSYNGTAANYYLYDRDDTGRFVHVHSATDEAFARTKAYLATGQNPMLLDPLWIPVVTQDQSPQSRPLMERLWAVPAYKQTYLRMLAQMLREGFDPNQMGQRINRLADLIRTDVYADPNKLYSNADFETNLTTDIPDGNKPIYGLLHFVQQRAPFLEETLNGYALKSDLRLNEVLAVNTASLVDEKGDHDAWLEITNLGPGKVNLSGLYLTDDTAQPTKWALPAIDVNDGQFQVLWLDGESGEGLTHAGFAVNNGTGQLYLYGTGEVLIDSVNFSGLTADQAWGRYPDGTGSWMLLDAATPGAANQWTYKSPKLYINEIMAANTKTIQDPNEPGVYEDWIEIYNAEDAAVDLSGMILTDNPDEPEEGWVIPQGIQIASKGYFLFWADSDPNDGPAHTNFKLGKDGECVGLFDTEEHVYLQIDKVTFGPQSSDVSYGRRGDGGTQWRFMTSPTPGRRNPQ